MQIYGTIHDHTLYQSFNKSVNATGLLGLKIVDTKRYILIHHYSLQSESDGQSCYFYEEGTLNQISAKWTFNSREGVSKPFAPSPAFLLCTVTAGRDIGLNVANATYVDVELVYSNDDQTMWALWKDGQQARADQGV